MQNISVTASAYPTHPDLTVLSVEGFLDTNTAPEFERVFQTVLGEKRFNLIIDLKKVEYISSAGWGIFVGEMKRIRAQKGNLFLTGMNPEVLETYELLEFDSIIKAFPSTQEAVVKGFKRTGAAIAAPKASAPKRRAKGAAAGANPRAEVEAPPVESLSIPAPRKAPWPFRLLLPWQWF